VDTPFRNANAPANPTKLPFGATWRVEDLKQYQHTAILALRPRDFRYSAQSRHLSASATFSLSKTTERRTRRHGLFQGFAK
jgi:hypothetical protein